MTVYKDNFNDFKIFIDKSLKSKYNFQGLWHFTDFSNLQSIFNATELSSRKICESTNIPFLDGANHEIINKATDFVHNCTRFYYRPQTPTLYDNEGIKPLEYTTKIHIPRPVYLLFSDELIYHKNTQFSNGNATNSPIDNSFDFFSNMDWNFIFHNQAFSQEERDYIINKRQAELLSIKPVSLKYLSKIIFRSNSDLKQAIKIFGQDNRYIVNENCFFNKNYLLITDWRYNNYITDYEITYGPNSMLLTIKLKNPLNNYNLSLKTCDLNEMNFKDVILHNFDNNLREKSKIKIKLNKIPYGTILNVYLNNQLSIKEIINT